MKPEEFGKVMEVSDLVAIHLTRYFPKKGILRTLNSVFPADTLRNTIHFGINHPVRNLAFYGNWDDSKYAVIAPLDELCREKGNQVRNFNVVDTYFVGDVKLPVGTTVLVSSQAYGDLIYEEGVIDGDTLMSKFGDERNLPQPNDKMVIEKDGIKYVVLSWNSENLREETYKEIAGQGYECMPGGQWNWGGNWGAEQQDQQRIAAKIGAKRTGVHCADNELESAEFFSSKISGASVTMYRRCIEAFLKVKKRDDKLNIDELDDDAHIGLKLLVGDINYDYSIPTAFEALRKLKERLPDTYHLPIDIFLEANKERLRTFIPPDIIHEYGLPL